jgi:hypothetical protein
VKRLALEQSVAPFGAVAAFLNALIAASMFAVAVPWIGPEAMSNPERMAEAAMDRRAALLTQDILKLASVAVSLVVIVVLARHIGLGSRRAGVAVVGTGLLGETALLGNAGFSLGFSVPPKPPDHFSPRCLRASLVATVRP